MSLRPTRTALSLLLPAVLLASGCGAAVNAPPARLAGVKTAQGPQARSVAPDDTAVLYDDTRHATYWQTDAQLVMSVHCTAFNTPNIAAAANVYFSSTAATDPDRYPDGCIFVARHYLIPQLTQFRTMKDYNDQMVDLVMNKLTLGTLGAYNVKAVQAFSIAHTFGVAPASPAPSAQPLPPPVAVGAHAAGAFAAAPQRHLAGYTPSRAFTSTRALLIQPAGQNPQWNLYGDRQKFQIDAVTAQVLGVTPQTDPNDQLNSGTDVDLQRAAATWLPLNPFWSNAGTAGQAPPSPAP